MVGMTRKYTNNVTQNFSHMTMGQYKKLSFQKCLKKYYYSGYFGYRGAFQTALDSYCCVMGWK